MQGTQNDRWGRAVLNAKSEGAAKFIVFCSAERPIWSEHSRIVGRDLIAKRDEVSMQTKNLLYKEPQ